jgi:inner membrane protein
MDLVTQGVLGATVAQASAKTEHIRLATWIGIVAGLLADADIFIRSSEDPLLTLQFHRHFTHSIFFIPFGALIAFAVLWPFLRKRLSPGYLYFYCFMGYLLSGFVDACTSYGTHLFWPLFEGRIAWNTIAIIDPIFTSLLILGVAIGFKTKAIRFPRGALVLAGIYLLFGLLQLQRAESAIETLAEERGHTIERKIVKPTIGNLILWRSVYLSGNRFYIDAVRTGFDRRVFEGESIARFDLKKAFPGLEEGTVLYEDIRRFDVFSDGYLGYFPGTPHRVGDFRYAIDPTSAQPLWGIEIDPEKADRHAPFETYRNMTEENRRAFMDMLLNRG